MPSYETILAGATATANEWRTLTIIWHVFVAAMLLAIAGRWRLSSRLLGHLLVLPLISVSGLAWISGNPFNGAVFAALSLVLTGVARYLPTGNIQMASRPYFLPGLLLVAFAWVYPHFLETTHWTDYVVAAPLGILPCPTLSALIGFTLMVGLLRPMAWSVTLGAAGLVYGMIGILHLGVAIDVGLLAGAALTCAVAMSGRQ